MSLSVRLARIILASRNEEQLSEAEMSNADRSSEDGTHSFVPLERLRRSNTNPPPSDEATLSSLGHHLESFSADLSERERAALFAILHAAAPDRSLRALGTLPPEAVLAPGEIGLLDHLLSAPAPEGRGLHRSLNLMMKGTRRCNLRCSYCHFWSDEPNQTMSFEVLARTIRGALAAPGVESVQFLWHGGEPTLLPITFYRKALWLQQRFRKPGQKVTNALQTNGTNLTSEWLAFLRDHCFLVGVSLDGPPEIHDRYRRDAAGRATAERVRESLASLRAHGMESGALLVVGEDIVEYGAQRLLSYFLEANIRTISLINVIPDNTPPGDPLRGAFLAWPRYVEFLRELFRVWWPALANRIVVRELSDLFRRVRGEPGQVCLFNGNCTGHFLTVEPTGAVSACEKYRGDADYEFGNVLEMELSEIPASERFARVHDHTATGIATAAGCPWFAVCQGACPHDRYLRTQRGIAHDERCCGLAPLLADMEAARLGVGDSHTSSEE